MPELPEVEIMAANLDRWTAGQPVAALEVCDPRVIASGDPQRAVGQQVTRAWRRAKYAILDLKGAGHLVFHFRMTGKLVPRKNLDKARLWLQVGDRTIAFEDARCLGQVWWVDSGGLQDFFEQRRLGPEPWPERRSGAWWAQQLHGLRGPIKPALMRQERVAGVGNILASESCWRAQLHPGRPTPSLGPEDWERLAAGVHRTIEHTLSAESGDEIVYVNQGGEGSFSVYGRTGQPCFRCRTPIVRDVQSGRASFHCPSCQLFL
jgi:formamidopyrimidine-DNA glycosylase